MNDLFGIVQPPSLPPGAELIEGFIRADQEAWLMDRIDALDWDKSIARRRQYYGKRYDHAGQNAKPMPRFLASLAELMTQRGVFGTPPDQVLINEYLPGQGIADHVDRTDNSGETVVSLSLLSDCVMDFKPLPSTKGEEVSRLLPRHSLLVLRGQARYQWTHGIAKRLNDKISGQLIPRARRVSITYRDKINVPEKEQAAG